MRQVAKVIPLVVYVTVLLTFLGIFIYCQVESWSIIKSFG
jgi:hypothetical protein